MTQYSFSLSQLAFPLLQHLDAERIEYCVLPCSRDGPDLNLLVDCAWLEKLPRVVHGFCAEQGLELVQCLQQARQSWQYVLGRLGEGRPVFLVICICGGDPRARQLQRPAICARGWWREQRRRWAHWRHPPGLLVACLGPDGSGKTSIIQALSARPMPSFLRVETLQLRPRIVRPQPKGKAASQTPSRTEQARGRAGRLAKLLMFVFDYAMGYWLKIRPKLVRLTLVVFDRYYDDMLVDPVRYRLAAGPQRLARLLLPWIPRPGLWLVLDVPPEVLKSRSSELGQSESARQRGEYRRVLRGHENAVVLDARQPLEEVVAHAERAIVAHLAQRTARRLGLQPETTAAPLSTRMLLFFCRHDVPILSRLVRIAFNSDIHCRLPPDVRLPHPYGVVIHAQAVIGRRVTVMQQVTIGGKDQAESVAPVIGNDVYIGAGARVLGDVRIGDGVVIGANAVVTRDIPAGMTVVGANRIVRRLRAVPGGGEAERPATVTQLTGSGHKL